MYIYHKINFTSGKIKIIHKMILRDFKMSGMGFYEIPAVLHNLPE